MPAIGPDSSNISFSGALSFQVIYLLLVRASHTITHILVTFNLKTIKDQKAVLSIEIPLYTFLDV